MNWYLSVLKNYAKFNGRARRKEYWFFVLFSTIVTAILIAIDASLGLINYRSGFGVLSGIYTLIVLIPSIAVAVRRLHDTNRSGWWMFILLIPLVGGIVIFVFMLLDSKPGNNRFGTNPKEISEENI